MGEIERDKLNRREHILNDCIGLTELLAIGLGMIWLLLTYDIFFSQQIDPPYTGGGKTEIAIQVFIYLPFCMLTCPSSGGAVEYYSWDNWKLFPRKIGWIVLFVASAVAALYVKPRAGKIVEDAVLQVYWPTYVIGLCTIALVIRIVVYSLFRAKMYPTIKRYAGKPSHFWRISATALITAFCVISAFLIIAKSWNIPNFIYSNFP